MRQRLLMLCLLVLLPSVLIGAGCTGSASEAPRAADGLMTTPAGTTEPGGTTESTEEFEVLDGEGLEVVAVKPALTKAEERGLMIFRHYCAHCHGISGEGDGQNSYGLEIPPRDLLTLELDALRTDDELRLVITEGGLARDFSPLMPPWGRTLEPRRIDDLIDLIHILPELEPADQDVDVLSLDDEDAGMDDFSL